MNAKQDNRASADEKAEIAKEEWLASRGARSHVEVATMNEAQTGRAADRVGTLLLAAILDYSHARAIALAVNLCALADGRPNTRAWLDLNSASTEIAHVFACYVAFGNDPVAKLRVSGHGLGQRAIVWFERVADDIAARLRGEPGVIPNTDDLPAPPPVPPTL